MNVGSTESTASQIRSPSRGILEGKHLILTCWDFTKSTGGLMKQNLQPRGFYDSANQSGGRKYGRNLVGKSFSGKPFCRIL